MLKLIIAIIYFVYVWVLARWPMFGLLISIFLIAGVHIEYLFFTELFWIGGVPISVYDMLVFPFLLFGLIIVLKKPRRILGSLKYITTLSLFVIAIISACWGLYNYHELRIVLREFRNLLYFTLIVLITGHFVSDSKRLSLVENTIIFCGITTSVWLIAYFLNSYYQYGLISSAALRTKYLLATVPAMASGLLAYKEWDKPYMNLLVILLQELFLISIITSLARSAWGYYAAVFILMLIFNLHGKSKEFLKLILILGCSASILFVLVTYLTRTYYIDYIGMKKLIRMRAISLLDKTAPENTFTVRVRGAKELISSLPFYGWLVGMGLGGQRTEIVPVWYLWKLGIIGLLIWMITYTAGFFHPCFYLDKSSKIKTEASKWFVATVPFLFIGSITGTFMTTAGYILSGLYIGINWKYIEINSKLENK